MTPFEASTLLLTHCDDFTDKAPRRQTLFQSFPTYPVSINTTTKKFGSGAIDLGDGVQVRGAYCVCRRPESLPFTLEGWVYIRSNAATSRALFGLHMQPAASGIPIVSLTINSSNRLTLNLRLSNGTYLDASDTSDITLNQWLHVAYTRDHENTLRLFLGGQQVGVVSQSVSDGTYTPDDYNFALGRPPGSALPVADALVDEVRFVAGYCVYAADFTPPAAPFDDCPLVDLGFIYPSDLTRKEPTFTSITKKYVAPIPSLMDVYHGGDGRIDATVKEKGTPDMPLRRKVRLVRERDGTVVRETWSDPVTGAYSFTNINRNERYTVISYDYEFNYRAVIADNLQPDAMT